MDKEFKVCQSCGKPFNESNLGSEADGAFSVLFCSACYQNGQFTRNLTLEEMQKVVEESLKDKPIPKFVRNRIVTNIQNLQRWASKTGVVE